MKTASVMRISDGSSDVCSSDLSTDFAHLDNAGDAVVLGTEASIAWAPFNGLLLSLNGGYSDGNISKPAANSEIRQGSRLPSKSEERRVGEKCVSKCRFRGSPDN